MSTLYTDNIRANNASQITVPTGQKIVGTDSGSIVAPGHVIQTLQDTYDTVMSTNSASHTTIMTVNITPKFNTSKILVSTQLWLWHRNYYTGYAGIFRGSTEITLGTDTTNNDGNFASSTPYKGGGIGVRTAESGDATTNWAPQSFSHTILDSPSTTSQITYTLQVWTNDGSDGPNHPLYVNSATGTTNSPRPICTLTCQEIAQ
jgi:hypothetical protein